MKLETIGANIRKYRKQCGLRQDKLAEKTELSTNYIGMIERGEKTPSLETFLTIAKVLNVSADMLLADVKYNGYATKDSLLTEKLNGISDELREMIYAVIDVIIKYRT